MEDLISYLTALIVVIVAAFFLALVSKDYVILEGFRQLFYLIKFLLSPKMWFTSNEEKMIIDEIESVDKRRIVHLTIYDKNDTDRPADAHVLTKGVVGGGQSYYLNQNGDRWIITRKSDWFGV